MRDDIIEEVLDSEFRDGSNRTLRDFLADCLVKLFVEHGNFDGLRAASDSSWYYTLCECLLPLDPHIGHYEKFNETETEFVIDYHQAAEKALVHVVNKTFGTIRRARY